MKKILLFLIILFCGQGIIFADSNESQKNTEKFVFLSRKPSNPNRPRCPGRHLTCMYAGDHVTIDLPESISFAEIDIKDNETSVVTGIITYSDPTMYFEPLSGSYDIFVITHSMDGSEQQYTATLNF